MENDLRHTDSLSSMSKLVHQTHNIAPKTALVIVDGVRQSLNAAARALELLSDAGGKLILLNVFLSMNSLDMMMQFTQD